MLLRVWSKVLYKQVVQFLLPDTPETVVGFIPGKTIQSISYDIAMRVEYSLHTGVQQHGLIIDVTKCFDLMPRAHVFSLMESIGFHKGFLAQWQALQYDNTRFCRVNRNLGKGLKTTGGFGQGDSLSIVPLLILGSSLAKLLRQTIDCEVFIYADNFAFITTDHSQIQ